MQGDFRAALAKLAPPGPPPSRQAARTVLDLAQGG
jgi:hypothetical protein